MSRTRRTRRVLLGLVAVPLVLAVGCAGTPTTPTTSTTTTTTTTTTTPPRDPFCEVWAQRLAEVDLQGVPEAEGLPKPTPPVPPYGYLLDADTVVTAREVVASGTDCKDPGSSLTFFNGSILSNATYRPKNNIGPDGPGAPVPQAYPLTLEAGRAQAPSVVIASFNVQLSPAGIRIWGTLRVTINGAVSTISFDGRFQDINNFSVALSTPALLIPGFTNDPIEASGKLERKGGLNSFDLDIKAPDLTVGDLAVRDVVVALHASTTTGLTLDLGGQVRAVNGFVGLTLDAAFDTQGRLRDIDGRLAVSVSSTTATGDPVQLDGEVTLTGSSTDLAAAFAGSATIGTDTYGRVGGSIRLDDTGLLVLDGYFDLAANGTTTRFSGSLTIDPSGATPVLKAQAAGNFSGLTAAGDIVEVDGNVTVTVVGGDVVTTVDGSLRVGGLRGQVSGTVTVTGDVTRIDLSGEVSFSGGKAQVAGVLEFADGAVHTVQLDGSLSVPFELAKLAVAGQLRISGDARGVSVALDGSVVGDGISVAGSMSLVVDGTGAPVSLRGLVSGTVSDGTWGAAGLQASLVADTDGAVLTGSGSFTGPGVNQGAVAVVATYDGAGTSLDASGQAYVNSGSKTVFGDFRVVNSELELARVGVVYPPIVIDPEYLWVRLVVGSGGSCTQVQLLDATFLAGLLFGIQRARADLACH